MTEIICNPIVHNEQDAKQHLTVHWLKEWHNNDLTESTDNKGIVISCTKIWRNEDGKFQNKTITSTFVVNKIAICQ